MLLCSHAQAEFSRSDIDDLKTDLLNFADSKCEDASYGDSALSIVGKLSKPISGAMTVDQASANDQLRDALSGVRDGIMSSVIGHGPKRLLPNCH
jgi:hypothetical protein